MRAYAFLPALLLMPTAVQAQDVHVGLGLSLLMPTGDFRSKTYGSDHSIKEGYDIGLGGQFTLSMPVDQKVALRFCMAGYRTDGTNTAPGLATLNLRHSLFTVGGEVQIFANSAYRQKGPYVFGGIHAHFERFDAGTGDLDYDYNTVETDRKSRGAFSMGMGLNIPLESGFRLNLEAAYHKTMADNDPRPGIPPTDFARVTIGFSF